MSLTIEPQRFADRFRESKTDTYYLAMASMAIGIGKITEKNYMEVYFRHKFLSHMSEYSTECPVTLQDIKNHIGLETNVSFETRGRWKNRIVESHMRTLSYNIRDEEIK